MGVGNYLIEFYGIHNFLADIDRDREFWRDGDHIVSTVLDYLSGEGFGKLLADVDVEYKSSAHEFRQRHLLSAINNQGAM